MDPFRNRCKSRPRKAAKPSSGTAGRRRSSTADEEAVPRSGCWQQLSPLPQVAQGEAANTIPVHPPRRAGSCPAWEEELLHHPEPSRCVCLLRVWVLAAEVMLCSEQTAPVLQQLCGCCSRRMLRLCRIRVDPPSGAKTAANPSMRHLLIPATCSLSDFGAQ